ncbi:MAG: glycerol-3-phosphate dehydrogenase [Candidatus Rokuibacteriota bacterium]|nr:MAG: glycerol-3-phosphate dehydrogenase [Candidatus Rokubacteria bacterium]
MARAAARRGRAGDADPDGRPRAERSAGAPPSDGGGPRASAARPAADARHADQGGRRDALHAGAAAATRPAHRRGADDAAQISGRATRGAPPRGSDRVIIAVLGGSHGAFATAADLSLAGHRVRLWRRRPEDLAALSKGITLKAEQRQGAARLDKATADLGEAVRDADVVIAPLPASTHEDLGRRLAGVLTERQVVLLGAATLGSFVIAREIARAGKTLPLALAETGTLPYLARKTGPAAVAAPVRAAHLPVGVFPAARAKDALARVRELYPATRPCVDAVDVALTNAGPVLHPPLVLANAGAIDRGKFDVHAAGTTESARRLIDAVDAERVASRKGWGFPAPHYEMATYYDEARAAEGLYGAGAKGKLVASGLWNEVLTFEHRYVTEDVELGLPFFESAARSVSVASPATSGLLGVFGALLGRPLAGRGRDLDHLGLGELTLREVRELFHEGWQSALWRRVAR